jgi:hypothetical protein
MDPSNLEKNTYQPPQIDEVLSAYHGLRASESGNADKVDTEILSRIGLDAYSADDNSKKELNLGDLNMFNDFISSNENLLTQEEGREALAMIRDIYVSMKSEISSAPDGELKDALVYDFEKLTELLSQKQFAGQIPELNS